MASRLFLFLIMMALLLIAWLQWASTWIDPHRQGNRVGIVPLHELVEQLRMDLDVERKVNRELLTENRKLAQQQHPPPSSSRLPAPAPTHLTVVMMSYPKSERFHRLATIIKEASSWNFTKEVILVWNGPLEALPKEISRLKESGLPLKVLPQKANRLDNRWRVGGDVQTEAVLNLDDDVNLKEKGARCMFDVWRSAPGRLVAVDVRAHSDSPDAVRKAEQRSGEVIGDGYAYSPRHTVGKSHMYSMGLPRALLGPRSMWVAYQAAPESLRAVVDSLLCDDIAFNFVAANHSSAAPVYVRAPFSPFPESQSSNSLQKLKNMKARRQKCLPALATVFGSIPLKYNSWYARCDWDGESGNHGKP